MICTAYRKLFGTWNEEEKRDKLGTINVWQRKQVYTEFWWCKLRERDNLENLDVDGRGILICILKFEWIGLLWRSASTCYHGDEIWGRFWLAEELAGSQGLWPSVSYSVRSKQEILAFRLFSLGNTFNLFIAVSVTT